MNESEKDELLIRIDERTLATDKKVEKIDQRFSDLDKVYVKKNEFEPIQKTFYILSRTIVVGLATGLLALLVAHAKANF